MPYAMLLRAVPCDIMLPHAMMMLSRDIDAFDMLITHAYATPCRRHSDASFSTMLPLSFSLRHYD